MNRILPILTHSASYQYILYKHQAIIQIPLIQIPFKLSDLQPIILNNNDIILCFNIPEKQTIKNIKDPVLKDIE